MTPASRAWLESLWRSYWQKRHGYDAALAQEWFIAPEPHPASAEAFYAKLGAVLAVALFVQSFESDPAFREAGRKESK